MPPNYKSSLHILNPYYYSMSSWIPNGEIVEKTQEELRDEYLLYLKNQYYSLIQRPVNTTEDKETCIRELLGIVNNEMLQIPPVSISTFDNLPFEIQLKYMCYCKCSELAFSIGNNEKSLDHILKALDLFSGSLESWKKAFNLAHSMKILYIQGMALKHIFDLFLQQGADFSDINQYTLLYIQYCWKMQDVESIQYVLQSFSSLSLQFTGELKEVLDYFSALFSPRDPFFPMPLPALPACLEASSLNALFSLSVTHTLQHIDSTTEQIAVSERSCWISVLDKVLVCLQEEKTNTTFEFIFPALPEQKEESSVNVPASSIPHEEDDKTTTPAKELITYLNNRDEIEARFRYPTQPTILNMESFHDYVYSKLPCLSLFPRVDPIPVVLPKLKQTEKKEDTERKKEYQNIPDVRSLQLSMQQADVLREQNCLRLLRSLVPASNRVSFIPFIISICDCLESFPILLLFETPIRLRLYYLLQLVAVHHPEFIRNRTSLVLLLHELQFWFTQSKTRIRAMPFYNNINQDFDASMIFPLDMSNAQPFEHLRYVYYLYQVELASKSGSRSRTNSPLALMLSQEITQWLQIILSSITPETSINVMISYRQNVILTDNQFICVNSNVIGVILPFYGSSSFLSDVSFQMNDDCIMRDIKLLNEKLNFLCNTKRENIQNYNEMVSSILELYNDLVKESRFLSFLNDHVLMINNLISFFQTIRPADQVYQVIHTILTKVIEQYDVYQNLLSGLVRNELSLLHGNDISPVLQTAIRDEAFTIIVILGQIGTLDIGISFFNIIFPFISIVDYFNYFYNYMINIPVHCYTIKACNDLWKNFVTVFLQLHNQWKDLVRGDVPFSLFLLEHSFNKDCSLLMRTITSIAQLAITEVSSLLSDKQRITSNVYSLLYLIVLSAYIILEAIQHKVIHTEMPVDYPSSYASLIQITNEFHSFVVTHSAICADNNGSFILFQLFLIASAPFSIEGENLRCIYQCLRCLFNLNINGTENHRVWSLATSESLYYRDVVIINYLSQSLSSLLPMLKPKMVTLMVEWLDFFNRRKQGAVINKENMYFGIYDPQSFSYIEDVLRLQTEAFTLSDISSLLERYKSFVNPLLSSLYMTKIMKVVNKNHREDLSFTTQIASEYSREGKWLILSLLYNPDNALCWSYFIQWLITSSFYEEDSSIFHSFASTSFGQIMQVIQYDRDPITSIIIPRNRNDVVYHNTFQLLQFLKQYKMSVLESILDIPQNNAYKSVYIQEPNETKYLIAWLPWKQYLVTCSIHTYSSTQVDIESKKEIIKQTILCIQKSRIWVTDVTTAWQDTLLEAILSILYHRLVNDLETPQVMDEILSLLMNANNEATTQCNADGKYYATLIRFQLIYYSFVYSPSAATTLQNYMVLKGEKVFYNPVFLFNAENQEMNLPCSFCLQRLRNKGITCYACGESFHMKCATTNELLTQVDSFYICKQCYLNDTKSKQLMFMKNCSAVCNHLRCLNSSPYVAKEFHIQILNDMRSLINLDESHFIYQFSLLYGNFYKRGTIIPFTDVLSKAPMLQVVYGRKRDYLVHRYASFYQSVVFFLKHGVVLTLADILEHNHKVSNTFTLSMIATVKQSIPELIKIIPFSLEIIKPLATFANCLLTVLKAKNKNYALDQDMEFISLLNALVERIRFTREYHMSEENKIWIARSEQLISLPPVISFQTVSKYIKDVLKVCP